MIFRTSVLALAVLLTACVPNQEKNIWLRIIKPHDGDTIYTPSIPIEGLTTVGAIVHVAGSLSDTGFLFPVDDTGHFGGQLSIEDLTGQYSAIFKVTLNGAKPIIESATITYISATR
jgi:hypothetical protein